MKKIIFFLVLFLLFVFFATSAVSAKRLLPRARPATGSNNISNSGGGSGSPSVSVKFNGNRSAINVTFSNLSSATSVSYIFSYDTRGTTQGASGSINVAENNTTREIIFGTCSHGVCRYDYGITNAKFVVTLNLTNGRRIVKTFRLKV